MHCVYPPALVPVCKRPRQLQDISWPLKQHAVRVSGKEAWLGPWHSSHLAFLVLKSSLLSISTAVSPLHHVIHLVQCYLLVHMKALLLTT